MTDDDERMFISKNWTFGSSGLTVVLFICEINIGLFVWVCEGKVSENASTFCAKIDQLRNSNIEITQHYQTNNIKPCVDIYLQQ